MINPKISVIVPIYGTEKYLDKCLNTIREQTLKDIEIICVDDCSPDNSYKVVERHRKQDKRIKLIRHEKNLGLGGARNTGIRAAKAEYLASVDSDDYIASDMLETLWRETDNGWFDIVCCGYNRVDENGNILSKVEYKNIQVINEKNSINIFTLLNPAFWNKLWRKSLFTDNEIFFPEHDYFEDMSTTPRLLAKAQYIKGVKATLYRYLVRDQSIMNDISDKHLIDYLKGFEIVYKFLKENNLFIIYGEEFGHFIQGNFSFYAEIILNSTLSTNTKNQYLRLLILFRITFVENYAKYNNYDTRKLLNDLNLKEIYGVYYQKYQDLLKKLDNKESIILACESKIADINIAYKEIREKYDETEGNLDKALKNIQYKEKIIKEKLVELEEMNFLIEGQQNKIRHLTERNKNNKRELKEVRELLSNNLNDLVVLRKETADKISFSQMLGVVFFAVLTYPLMTKKQTIKLVNKPKIFFRDSKSYIARGYASLLKII